MEAGRGMGAAAAVDAGPGACCWAGSLRAAALPTLTLSWLGLLGQEGASSRVLHGFGMPVPTELQEPSPGP